MKSVFPSDETLHHVKGLGGKTEGEKRRREEREKRVASQRREGERETESETERGSVLGEVAAFDVRCLLTPHWPLEKRVL